MILMYHHQLLQLLQLFTTDGVDQTLCNPAALFMMFLKNLMNNKNQAGEKPSPGGLRVPYRLHSRQKPGGRRRPADDACHETIRLTKVLHTLRTL